MARVLARTAPDGAVDDVEDTGDASERDAEVGDDDADDLDPMDEDTDFYADALEDV